MNEETFQAYLYLARQNETPSRILIRLIDRIQTEFFGGNMYFTWKKSQYYERDWVDNQPKVEGDTQQYGD